jgi:hypothetical protein
VWSSVSEPTPEIGEDEPVERVSLDIRKVDFEFLGKLASFRNALADAQKKKIKRRWSRKSMIETQIAVRVEALRAQMEEMFAELGPMPDAKDDLAMKKYATRVVAHDKKFDK